MVTDRSRRSYAQIKFLAYGTLVLSSDHLSFVYTQELVGLVKELKGEISSLKGTDHVRRFNRLRDELKAYCHAIDFNDTVALNKLRATLDEARLSQADDTAKLSALWDRLTFAKQAGRHVDLRATIFGCLASEAEREADKLVRHHELRSSRQPGQYRGERRTSQVFRRDQNDRRRSAANEKCYACGDMGHFARDCHKRREQPTSKKPRTE